MGFTKIKGMKDTKYLLPLLRCPHCHSSELSINEQSTELLCNACERTYPIIGNLPVLLRHNNELFRIEDYCIDVISSLEIPQNTFQNLVPTPSVNLASKREMTRMREMLISLPSAKILIIGGGQQKQWLDESLEANNKVCLIYSDIDISADVDLFCDGHELPFIDATFDAIITTAVLEHVLYPEQVAAEIKRVLKVGGVLYSELPFMQQVHEGAYDFTRYTLSGHRRLFNGFEEIEAGMVAGPGTALLWAIENFVLAFFTGSKLRNLTKVAVRFSLVWLKYFDYLFVNRPEAMDGASCTFFLGKKIDGCVSDEKIIDQYVGAKKMRHV